MGDGTLITKIKLFAELEAKSNKRVGDILQRQNNIMEAKSFPSDMTGIAL